MCPIFCRVYLGGVRQKSFGDVRRLGRGKQRERIHRGGKGGNAEGGKMAAKKGGINMDKKVRGKEGEQQSWYLENDLMTQKASNKKIAEDQRGK